MTPEELRPHIASASRHSSYRARQLALGIIGACWPGGPADHMDPAGLGSMRFWRPDRGERLPECTCARGHCLVCN